MATFISRMNASAIPVKMSFPPNRAKYAVMYSYSEFMNQNDTAQPAATA